MRMEAKNHYFKKIAQISNFKNVALTVAKRHQLLLCSYLQSNIFFQRHLECGPGIYNNNYYGQIRVTLIVIFVAIGVVPLSECEDALLCAKVVVSGECDPYVTR